MSTDYLHGVEVIQLDDGPRPIRTVKSSVIGLVGTAPDADASHFPLNTPVLIAGSRSDAAKLDTTGNREGTLPKAMDGIFDQAGAMVVVVRVEEGADDSATQTNVIGSAATYTGIYALLAAESQAKVKPRILIAPGFTHVQAVLSEMVGIADSLHAVIYADGPNTDKDAAVTYRQTQGSRRIYLCDPWVRVWDTTANAEAVEPSSARLAGVRARVDNEKGFWHSISNELVNGILGTARAVDFNMGDVNCQANYLNENGVATIIQQNGYRTWGNLTCSSDAKWQFEPVVRTADMVNDSILANHLWAVDRGITSTYNEDVAEGVNGYLRHLKNIGAILGGESWADPELNTPEQISQGNVTFDFDFTPVYPADRITFRSHMVNNYITEIF